MPEVTVRFWAGAQRAAGMSEDTVIAQTIGELRGLLSERAGMAKICAVASFLVDSDPASDATALHTGAVVDLLPPFAGG